MEIIFLIIGILVGIIITKIYMNPRLKTKQEIDKEIIEINEEAIKINNKLNLENEEYVNTLSELKKKVLEEEKNLENIKLLQKEAEESADIIYQKSYELANEKIDKATQELSNTFKNEKEEIEKEYLNTLKECVEDFQKQIKIKQNQINDAEEELKDLTTKVSIAVEANKRAEEIKAKKDFYRLQLSQKDIAEIAKLREVSSLLRDEEPLNKVIWKVYYEKPCTDLIGRVVGTGTHTGIYKITNIENQMCYVGQSKDISSRIKQHIKRGIGAETPTKNKLYPAMLENGVENFTFEIIEECDKTLLNEREDYWQEYFHSKDYGYSIK